MASATSLPRPSTWAPLAIGTFRMLWIAQLISNVGTWMQNLGAQWMLVHQPNATALTALAQAAGLLPVLFFSLPAGVLADILDRRRFLLGTQVSAILVVTLLTVLTAAGLASPSVIILLTFALGITTALSSPAWQAIQPQLVPRELIPSAAALGGMSMNAARAIGPAIAGVLLALTSPAVLFGINAASTLLVVAALLRWRPVASASRTPERIIAGLRAGSRYVAHSPITRRILLRTAVFILPASALWALLAIISADRLGLGSGGYGLLLGSLGAGAVLGALVLGRLRARMAPNRMLATFSLLYAVGMLGSALVTVPWIVMLLLVVSGVGWLVMLTVFNTTLQLMLADWVRARGLAVYQLVFLGGQGLGAVLWGAIGQRIGASQALLIATGVLVVGVLTLPLWRLHTRELDLTIGSPWPDPVVDVAPDPHAGPVLVEVNYCVDESHVAEFLAGARLVERARRRTGATSWAMYQDVADRTIFVEVFTVPTWGEHLRQHYERTTGTDATIIERARRFELDGGEDATSGRHLLAVRLD